MKVWSLATADEDSGGISVSLYLEEWQAYEALIHVISPWDPDGDSEVRNRCDATLEQLHRHGPTDAVVDAVDDLLDAVGISAEITAHDHPWVFGETA